ncbi:hypothetical protein [Palleronia caenipelagi]|uniref:Uncharacterized protein n=1 Tax=Palleronia caenipelagi TaxID=2489174 RepID=A0A547PW49_9RHOB|nr:hypothetical protein [Palleronia caenipelagi]TRD18379.1 hypothetical protein FEV53_12035 [Palleronia caenipelagi]
MTPPNLVTSSRLTLGPNGSLPDLPAWRATSFWVQLLSVAIMVASAFGIDLLAVFGQLGLGDTPDEILATGEQAVSAVQILASLGLSVWAYLERQAPHFRLRFGR